jgi:hypothetical protein
MGTFFTDLVLERGSELGALLAGAASHAEANGHALQGLVDGWGG